MIDKKLYKGLFDIGKIIPKTTQEILDFEKIHRKTQFPDVSDITPSEVIKKKITLESDKNKNNESFDNDSISMAARNGVEITEQLLKKMHRDRDEIENNDE